MARDPRSGPIGVAGAGTMGAGIAQIACLAGYETHLHDPDAGALERGAARLREALGKGVERRLWTSAQGDEAAGRLVPAPELARLGGCSLVIEAAPEELAVKHRLFEALSAACRPEAILATNTSSLSVTAIAAAAERPERVCGMHFFNPPALMRLVEIVAGDETAEETLVAAADVASAMGREPVRAADAIGFIGNRVNRPFTLEALRLLGDGVAPHDQIDRIVRVGGGYRMGPFELMDLVGVDVNLEVARSFWEQSFGEPRWRPHPLQTRMVAAGRLGRKAGRGWYDYRDGPHRDDDPAPASSQAPEAEAVPARIDGDGFTALSVEGAGLAALGAAPDALGYVALPDLARARLVELAPGPKTTAEAISAAGRHFRSIGKHVELVGSDAPGLVLGRIVCQLVNEARFAEGAGIGEASDIDTALRLGFNHPRGPFEWEREIGAARVLAVLDGLRAELGEERYRAAPSLRRAAAAGARG